LGSLINYGIREQQLKVFERKVMRKMQGPITMKIGFGEYELTRK
jgi:hypothetical protein